MNPVNKMVSETQVGIVLSFVDCDRCENIRYKDECPGCGHSLVNIEDTPVEEGDPQRARKTLPQGLCIAKSGKHGKGVFTDKFFDMGIRFGPYEGIKKDPDDPAKDSGYAFRVNTMLNKI